MWFADLCELNCEGQIAPPVPIVRISPGECFVKVTLETTTTTTTTTTREYFVMDGQLTASQGCVLRDGWTDHSRVYFVMDVSSPTNNNNNNNNNNT